MAAFIVILFAVFIALFSLIYLILNLAATEIFDVASTLITGSDALTGLQWAENIFVWAPFVVLIGFAIWYFAKSSEEADLRGRF